MEIEQVLRFEHRNDFRDWLERHADDQSFCWVILSRKNSTDGLLYLDAVEEALCFGWIDGIAKRTADGELAQRFSPKRKRSNWTELNKERVRRLQRLDLMDDRRLRVLPDMSSESFVIDEEISNCLKEDEQVFKQFMDFPELYRRIRIDTIQSVSEDRETYLRRLDKLIEKTKANEMYGQWNDDGRLIE